MTIDDLTERLKETVHQFLGDSLYRYPELLGDEKFNAICEDLKGEQEDFPEPEDNPAYRLVVFLSEYRDCIELPSYAAVYETFAALMAAGGGEEG